MRREGGGCQIRHGACSGLMKMLAQRCERLNTAELRVLQLMRCCASFPLNQKAKAPRLRAKCKVWILAARLCESIFCTPPPPHYPF